RITALVGRQVKRTFSESSRFSTGLPGPQTHEAKGQYLGNFQEAVRCVGCSDGPMCNVPAHDGHSPGITGS
ncbi:MAG: hypothetical protein JWL86_185, partial [Rhizobium sp.]|nr:hypothetical protein [Rhizobium sp.]